MTTTLNGKVSPARNAVSGLRTGPYLPNDDAPAPGTPEAAAAIARAVARLNDPAERKRSQRTPPVGRAAGEPKPKPATVRAFRPRSDPAVTARAIQLRADGLTWPAIGKALGESPAALRFRCQRERTAA